MYEMITAAAHSIVNAINVCDTLGAGTGVSAGAGTQHQEGMGLYAAKFSPRKSKYMRTGQTEIED